ncbi:hypothetical protein V0288_06465 [Pannus brasiliensis CCIBt3594]|uniref:Uncharacterized protein n=1 Tax=Pannus brasiliensis CCIBt3594 TaxID=1427578 RepID=A0AAW9QTD8_9CHRO
MVPSKRGQIEESGVRSQESGVRRQENNYLYNLPHPPHLPRSTPVPRRDFFSPNYYLRAIG